MSKKAFEAIEQGLLEAIAYGAGDTHGSKTHEIEVPDVAAARESLHLTQKEFSRLFAISLTTLRNWEQGVRKPEGPARVLIKVIEREPKAVLRALHSTSAAPAKPTTAPAAKAKRVGRTLQPRSGASRKAAKAG